MSEASHPTITPGTGSGVVYTCPMHPEVREGSPGRCPICGMNLVPADEQGGSPAPQAHAVYTCPMHPPDPRGHAGTLPDLRHEPGARRRGGWRIRWSRPDADGPLRWPVAPR